MDRFPEQVIAAASVIMNAFLSVPEKQAQLLTELGALRREVALMQERLPPTLVSVHDAAERLSLHPKTVRKWVRTRRLRSIQVDGVIRVDLGSIAAVLAER
jgi:excisionase family DNA binding protein